jgi:hypothetical protein
MYNVCVCKCNCHEVMYMSREASKTCLVAHEAVDKYKQYSAQV